MNLHHDFIDVQETLHRRIDRAVDKAHDEIEALAAHHRRSLGQVVRRQMAKIDAALQTQYRT